MDARVSEAINSGIIGNNNMCRYVEMDDLGRRHVSGLLEEYLRSFGGRRVRA